MEAKRERRLAQHRAINCVAVYAAFRRYRLEILPKLSAHPAWAAAQRMIQRRWIQLNGIAATEEDRHRHHRADQARAIACAAAAAALVREKRQP